MKIDGNERTQMKKVEEKGDFSIRYFEKQLLLKSSTSFESMQNFNVRDSADRDAGGLY